MTSMPPFIRQARGAQLMGNFTQDPLGRRFLGTIPKDVGCARTEREPYYYYGKCIDCPLHKCLEDSIIGTEHTDRPYKKLVIRVSDRRPGRPQGSKDKKPRVARKAL